MKKYRVLQLGLQLGFLVTTNICNSWYLYNLKWYQTSCSNCSGHPMLYTILYIHCNSHATICNFFATNFHVKFPHTFQHGEQNANLAFHPFVNKWCMLIPFTTYLQLSYNYFTTSSTNIFFHCFIHPFDVNGFYPNPLQLIYNYFKTSLTNIFLYYFIHPFDKWTLNILIFCNLFIL
jgi:hypothetical protein